MDIGHTFDPRIINNCAMTINVSSNNNKENFELINGQLKSAVLASRFD